MYVKERSDESGPCDEYESMLKRKKEMTNKAG
jgi:hypothetical protein